MYENTNPLSLVWQGLIAKPKVIFLIFGFSVNVIFSVQDLLGGFKEY